MLGAIAFDLRIMGEHAESFTLELCAQARNRAATGLALHRVGDQGKFHDPEYTRNDLDRPQ
jgi:hypothetical protein